MQLAFIDPCLDSEILAAYIDGRLDRRELDRADRHIDTCRRCRGELSALAALHTAPRAPRAEPALRFGRYVVLREIARGANGLVVRAYDPELARAVAVKVLRHVDAGARDRLRREARAMARLAHENVVAVYDVVADVDCVCVAMELVDGDTLRGFARTADRAAIVAACVAAGRGLAAAHAAHLVHRDFKPDNVLCGHDGRVAVTDFGLARPSFDPGGTAGTPAYMAPELYLGKPATVQTDQWAFCVSTYEALAGRRPFVAPNVRELRDAILRRDPAPSPRIPPRIWRVLARGLARDPAARFPCLAELVDALAADPLRHVRRYLALGTAAVLGAIAVRALR